MNFTLIFYSFSRLTQKILALGETYLVGWKDNFMRDLGIFFSML